MKLYGKQWTRTELEARVGRLEQIGGLRRMMLAEGREEGVQQIEVRTGAGLTYYVSTMRGMDISRTEFESVPISWQSPNGDVHPSYYDPNGVEWNRTAVGGLLMTCGLTQVGTPCEEAGHKYGLHGRAHHTPARRVCSEGAWIGEEFEITIKGVVEESQIFGEFLTLARKITSRLGENKIWINDEVENHGQVPSPHMMLYHFNFGFPLMMERTRIQFPARQVVARDKGTPVTGYDVWDSPQEHYQERVYYHEMTEDGKGLDRSDDEGTTATVVISNPDFPFADGAGRRTLNVSLTWDTHHLARLVEWKMPGLGTHVLGIEPANCHVEGRAAERKKGSLVILQPSEKVSYSLVVEVNARSSSD